MAVHRSYSQFTLKVVDQHTFFDEIDIYFQFTKFPNYLLTVNKSQFWNINPVEQLSRDIQDNELGGLYIKILFWK